MFRIKAKKRNQFEERYFNRRIAIKFNRLLVEFVSKDQKFYKNYTITVTIYNHHPVLHLPEIIPNISDYY